MNMKKDNKGQRIYFVAYKSKREGAETFNIERQASFQNELTKQWLSYICSVAFNEKQARSRVEKLQAEGFLACAYHAGYDNRGFKICRKKSENISLLCGDSGVVFGL